MPNATLRDESILWKMFNNAKHLPKAAARQRVIADMAAEYNVPPSSITQREQGVLYTNVSKIMRLIQPKHPRASRNLQNEIARGGLNFNDALEIARGNAATREECALNQSSSADTPSLRFELVPLFSAVISAARQAGYEKPDITSAFDDALDAT